MPEYCTCGAKLPEDARFCHKCGKPQRDEPLLVQDPEELPPPIPLALVVPALQFPPIGFHNGPAVRIALLFGLLSLVMSALSGQLLMPAVFLIWLIAAGFLCVLFYRRRTGQRLSMAHGAHLGWICGFFVFAIIGVIAAARIAVDPSVLDAMRDQIKASAAPGTDVAQAFEVMRSPAGIAVGLLVAFLLFTALPAFGGAIGAKLLDRELKPPL